MKTFADLQLPPQVQRALTNMGFESPTPVQAKAIPAVLENRDVLVTAETGSGKTAAFGVPILTQMLREIEAPLADEAADELLYQGVERMNKRPKHFVPTKRALILAPTRELAEQIAAVIEELTWSARRFKHTVIIGGAGYGKQLFDLRQTPAFVIGTPGRLIDHIKRGALNLDDFAFLVIDEADRLLDMGFEPQIHEIVSRMPKQRQTMMFSATLPGGVKKLVESYLRNPVRISIGEQNRPVERIKQDVIELVESDKPRMLISEIDKIAGSIIVFTRTRARADRVAKILSEAGHQAGALHGDMSQGQRRKVTDQFRSERIRILVATDIAARGLDISHIKHVLNYDIPMVPEDYVHRIGRTARNGAEGHSLSFVNQAERHLWLRILKFTGQPMPKTFSKPPRFSDQGKFRGPARENTSRGFLDKKRSKQRGDEVQMFDRERDLLAEPARFGVTTDTPKRPRHRRNFDTEGPQGRREDTRPYRNGGKPPVARKPVGASASTSGARKPFGASASASGARKPFGTSASPSGARKPFAKRAEAGESPKSSARFGDGTKPPRKPSHAKMPFNRKQRPSHA